MAANDGPILRLSVASHPSVYFRQWRDQHIIMNTSNNNNNTVTADGDCTCDCWYMTVGYNCPCHCCNNSSNCTSYYNQPSNYNQTIRNVEEEEEEHEEKGVGVELEGDDTILN